MPAGAGAGFRPRRRARFHVGYSPERINPGDKTAPLRDHHQGRLGAGCARRSISSPTSTARWSTAGIHRAPSIKVAEAAKVIENTQRDLNIAFMNELSAIFHQLGIDTGDVLAAAATKWNFLNFQPGLVGGHCIGVDPYYLTYRAEKAGYHPEIILAGRRINDGMGQWIARECVRSLTLRNCTNRAGHDPWHDLQGRRARYPQFQGHRHRAGARAFRHARPGARSAGGWPTTSMHEYGIALTPRDALQPADAVILAVAHRDYLDEGWPLMQQLLRGGKGTVLDVKSKLDARAKTGRHRSMAAVAPILVTGAAGFIGFHVARRLLQDGQSVVGLDNLNDYYDPKLKEARLAELAKFDGFEFAKLNLADREGMAALFAQHRFPHVVHLAAQAGVRHSLIDPSRLCRRQSGRLHQYPRRLPPQRLPASALCVVVVGLRRQHPHAVFGARQRGPSAQPLRRLQEGQRADGARLCPSVPAADDGLAVLHRLRPLGPPRHGDVALRQGDHGRRADQAVQQRRHAARLHLYRRHRRGDRAAGRRTRRRRTRTGRAKRPIPARATRPGGSTISATTIRSS